MILSYIYVNVPVSVDFAQNVSLCLSVGTSEIDMSSPLNFGTPSSMMGRTPRTPGAQGTPIRTRPDVRSERKMRTVNVGGSGGSEAVSTPQE